MSKIKSVRLLVPYAGCDTGEEVKESPTHLGRWYARGKRVALITDDLRTLAAHGIVEIVEEGERMCLTCKHYDGYKCNERTSLWCANYHLWQPRPDPVEKLVMVSAHPIDCKCSKCYDAKINGHSIIQKIEAAHKATDNKPKENTMNEFKREHRYVVIKISDMNAYLDVEEIEQLETICEKIRTIRERAGRKPMECVVVESDWPEYEPTWKAIEARMTGKPTATGEEWREPLHVQMMARIENLERKVKHMEDTK